MRIPILDSLRGIFALMVVLLHMPAAWTFVNHPLVRNDGISVDFFFVLSGFVISFAYADRIRSRSDLNVFLVKRIGRIWPLHSVILIAFLALAVVRFIASKQGITTGTPFFGQPEFWPVFLQDMFFLNAFRTTPSFELNFPTWSIGAEFWTYVLFGFLILSGRYFAHIAAILMAVSLLVLLGYVDPGFGQAFGWAIFRSVFFFLAGYFTFRLWKFQQGKQLFQPNLFEFGMVLVVILAIVYRQSLPLQPLFFALIFGATILVFSFQSGMVSRMLLWRPMRMIGERSYSIYLVHILILTVMGIVLRIAERKTGLQFFTSGLVGTEQVEVLNLGYTWANNLFLMATIGLIVWVSGLTVRLIERPGQRLASRLVNFISVPERA